MYLILFILIITTISLQARPIALKTAAQKSYPKYYFNDSSSKNMEGLCIEIMQAIHKIDPDIRFTTSNELEPLARIISHLKRSRIDAFVGLSRSEERKKFLNFSIPIYELHRVVAARQNDDVQIGSYADIRALKTDNGIMSLFGSNNLAVLKQHQLNITGTPSSVAQGLLMLIKYRGRFFSYHDLGIINTIKKNNMGDKVKILPTYLETFEQHIAYPKTVPQNTIRRIDSAIRTLQQNGNMQIILDRYFQL